MSKYLINGTNVLKNKLGLNSNELLDAIEGYLSALKLIQNQELLRSLNVRSLTTLFEIHKIMFCEIYDWAGQTREENISKGDKLFHPIELFNNAKSEIQEKLSLAKTFQDIIIIYSDLNHFHPFREGNGRSTRVFVNLLLEEILNKHISWSLMSPAKYLELMINDDINQMTREFEKILLPTLEETYDIDYKKNIIASYEYENIYFTEEQLKEL